MTTPQPAAYDPSRLLDAASTWALSQEAEALARGAALTADQLREARILGVQHPDRVRVLRVDRIPSPTDLVLCSAAQDAGLSFDSAEGITFRYGILLKVSAANSRRLLAHELVHVGQYERYGGIPAFLATYLRELLALGYTSSPLEIEARRASEKLWPR